MKIVVVILILCIVFLILIKRNSLDIEDFNPAWNNYVIYTELSKRLRIGIWRGWININGLMFMQNLLDLTNSEIRFYESNEKLLDDLLIHKHIDLAFLTEAEYGIYIANKLDPNETQKSFTKGFIKKNKETILKNFSTRRVFTLYPMYRFLLADFTKIKEPSDLHNKVIQISNITNGMYKLDLELLKNIDYNKVFREFDRGTDRFSSIQQIGKNIDAYFTEYNYPDPTVEYISKNTLTIPIDTYRNDSNDKLFPRQKDIENLYFFLKKDKMSLKGYPEFIQRRKQVTDFYKLPYDPKNVNCYSFKTMIITRDDVENEYIYNFSKTIIDNLGYLKNKIQYFRNFDIPKMYTSNLDVILPIHSAVYYKDNYFTKIKTKIY